MKSNFTILFAFLLILEHCGPPKLGTYTYTYIYMKKIQKLLFIFMAVVK